MELACTDAKEIMEEVLANMEDLCESASKEKEEADSRIAKLEKALSKERKALDEERKKSAELTRVMELERVAYPDLYGAVVEQFKQSTEYQIAADVVVAASLAKEERGEVGPSSVATVEVRFRQRVEVIFLEINFDQVEVGGGDIACTPLNEVVNEEDLIASEGESGKGGGD
ncbi:hypothetical protein CsSME_00045466 [Camellia sinensis var. sinensis]